MQWLIRLIFRTLTKTKVAKAVIKAKKVINTAKSLGVNLLKRKMFPKNTKPDFLINVLEEKNKNQKEYLKYLEQQEQKLLRKQEREHERNVKNLERLGEKDKIRLDKWLEKKAKEQEKENKPRRIKDNETGVNLIFNSSWIRWGMFIHYWTKKRKDGKGYYKSRNGVMLLKLYNTKSFRNPTLIYQWIKVKISDWKEIISDKTGTNFWAVWYHRNRKKQRYLTMQSKYFDANERVKQDIREFSKYNTNKKAIERERARLKKYYGTNRRF